MASSSYGRQTGCVRRGVEDCLARRVSSPLGGRPARRASVRARRSARGLGSGLGMGGRASRPPATGWPAGESLSPEHGSSRTIRSRRSSRSRRVGARGDRALVVAPSRPRSARTRTVTGTHGRLKALSEVRRGCVCAQPNWRLFCRGEGEGSFSQVAAAVQRWIASMRSAGEQGFAR